MRDPLGGTGRLRLRAFLVATYYFGCIGVIGSFLPSFALGQGLESCPFDSLADVRFDEAMKLRGNFDVHFVVTGGPTEHIAIDANLSLFLNDSELMHDMNPFWDRLNRNVYYPAFGSLEGNVDTLGMVMHGNTVSLDPQAPGVQVSIKTYRSYGYPHTVELALGNERNQRGLLMLDGATAILSMTGLSRDQFWGSWESGWGITNYRVEGLFCAVRRN